MEEQDNTEVDNTDIENDEDDNATNENIYGISTAEENYLGQDTMQIYYQNQSE